ncbi:tumor necrosis factor receptor superfamily member 6-like isoform X1 [Stegastes partitus]|uniref:Tumor necrosis factor receptor superfamily member 6-like isoform X1 n=1 Tax=Stegastes partitus TaxID=144197 RepID=A0A9Y4JQM2_9TELE|nr:PREDICTED: tumor necrosis factor receptor superfamily member 6-like isoform X1 [Stegastes partitus]
MNNFLLYTVFSVLIWLPKSTRSYPQSGLDLRDSRTQQDLSCRDNLEYPHGNICCLNCPAGTHVESPCTKAGEKGKCEECDFGTFIEHANGLKQCFKCTLCRSDQEIVRSCTHTQDTECRCKSGRFCDPDQACEVCKKCSRCKKDEETVRNCTSTSNTECKKIQAKSDSSSGKAWVIAIIVVGAVLLVGVIIFATYKWRRRKQESQRPGGMKAGLHYTDTDPTEGCRDGETRRPSNTNLSLSRQLVRAKSPVGVEDERKMLCESLNSSASNSQHSLNGPSYSAFPASSQASPKSPGQPNRREDRQFPELVPVNGEESLRSCFELFEEVAVDQCKKFFRHLGISDNVIKSRETLSHEEMIHELLNIWIEKVGREANLNELLKVLLDINQRRTAEIIKERAVQNGEYFCKS